MKRSAYALLVCITDLVNGAVVFWLFAGKISTDVAEHLPEKNASTYTIAVLTIVVTGGWRQIVRPRGSAHHGLDIALAVRMARWSHRVGLLALLRFILPLMTTSLGMFSRKPNLPETLLWGGLLYASATGMRLVAVFLKRASRSADEAMSKDSRKPVLYLRSFDKELKKAPGMRWSQVVRSFSQSPGGFYLTARLPGDATFNARPRIARDIGSRRTPFDEQMVFAQAFERIGPYIAIGRPNEGFQDTDLGAAKKYVADAEWQFVIRRWLADCAAVIIEAGDSASLGWEIDQVVASVPPQHVIVMCPYTEREYASFVQAHVRCFPNGLPEIRPESRLLMFDNSWRAIELTNVNANASETLAPFYAQIGANVGGGHRMTTACPPT
jgi:hypothetical protein